MKQDLQIFNLIKKEEERQTMGIELIASENYVSDQVLEALGSICTNKYAEGYPGARYYGGCEVIDQIEQLAIDRVCQLFDAEYANVQPHSGAQANMAVMMACLKPGDTFMGLDLSHGGHLTHGSPVNMSGILYHAVSYGLDEVTGLVDYNRMEELALKYRPKLIFKGMELGQDERDCRQGRCNNDGRYGTYRRPDSSRSAQQSCQICTYRHLYDTQDTKRPSRRYHPDGKGL